MTDISFRTQIIPVSVRNGQATNIWCWMEDDQRGPLTQVIVERATLED